MQHFVYIFGCIFNFVQIFVYFRVAAAAAAVSANVNTLPLAFFIGYLMPLDSANRLIANATQFLPLPSWRAGACCNVEARINLLLKFSPFPVPLLARPQFNFLCTLWWPTVAAVVAFKAAKRAASSQKNKTTTTTAATTNCAAHINRKCINKFRLYTTAELVSCPATAKWRISCSGSSIPCPSPAPQSQSNCINFCWQTGSFIPHWPWVHL